MRTDTITLYKYYSSLRSRGFVILYTYIFMKYNFAFILILLCIGWNIFVDNKMLWYPSKIKDWKYGESQLVYASFKLGDFSKLIKSFLV